MTTDLFWGIKMACRRVLQLVVCVFATICCALQGCAGSVPSPAKANIKGAVAVYLSAPASGEEMALPGTGILSDSRRGAAAGSGYGAYVGSHFGMGAILFVPLLATVGAAGGAVYGAVAGKSHATVREADRFFTGTVKEADIGPLLVAEVAGYLAGNGYQTTPLPLGEIGDLRKSLSEGGYDAAVEIDGIIIALVPTEVAVNPQRRIQVTAHVRLIRCTDGHLLDQRDVVFEQGPARTIEAWMGANAAEFRQEIPPAIHGLAERVATELLLGYPLPPKTVRTGTLRYGAKVHGLVPLTPSLPDCLNPRQTVEIGSVQPTLSWEPYPVAELATYDIRIWKALERYDRFDGRILNMGAIAYNREGLTETTHKVEISLEPYTTYFWSVRARFVANGKVRVTDWSKYAMDSPLFIDIMTLGLSTFIDSQSEPTYCPFRTPQLPSP